PAKAADRIRGRTIAVVLAAALDNWADVCRRTRGKDDLTWKHLLAVARLADPDPLRNQLRDAWGREPRDRKALELLAKSQRLTELPASTLVLLAGSLWSMGAKGQAVGVLYKAQQQYPGDFWINHNLGYSLNRMQPHQLGEVIRFYTAAVALRP